MVRINGKNFDVYNLDNEQSIINRIASNMDTLPEYIYFPQGIPSNFMINKNIKVENLLDEIKNDQVDVNVMYEKIIPKLSQQMLDLAQDVFRPYIIYNKTIKGLPESFRPPVLLDIEQRAASLGVFIKASNIWEQRRQINASIIDKTEVNKNQVKQQLILFKQFDKIKTGIKYTKFELIKSVFELTLNISDISLLEVFNNIILNENVPFATTHNFYKILKDFIPPSIWSDSYTEFITLKVLEKQDVDDAKPDDYTDTIIAINNDGKIEAGLNLSVDSNNLSREQFITRFIETIKTLGDINIESIEESEISGVFYFLGKVMNKYVFADMVMNNPLFSSMLSIDEHTKATKQKSGIYIHFSHFSVGKITATLTQQIADKGDPILKSKNANGVKIGDKYIRVKIRKARNTESVHIFMNMLSKLFVIYDNNYESIVSEYKKFIPDFGKIEIDDPIILRSEKLKDIAPDIFVSGYAKKCINKPTIVNDKEAQEAQDRGQEVMIFPNPNEDSEPRNYICNHSKNIYPGLRENPLKNANKFPFVPCCYVKNQADTKGSIYRHYFLGEELSEKVLLQQDLLKTKKFMNLNIFGMLPENITRMFNIINTDHNYKFVRKGMIDTKSSFLNCVLVALNMDDIVSFNDKDEIEAILYKNREQLATPENAALCRQEMYDSTIEEILQNIGNFNIYFDPKLFISLLETIYECNIILFSRDDETDEMILPRHSEAYYKTRTEYPYIFIYEHMGSHSDHAKYPRCELISMWLTTESENHTYVFPYSGKIGKGIHNIYNKLRKAYALNKYIPEAEFNLPTVLEQGIDSYGKCRMVNILYKNNISTLFTEPLQPFQAVETWDIKKTSIENALVLAADLRIIITRQTIVKNVVKELIGTLGNIRVTIPVIDDIPVQGIPEYRGDINYPINNFSAINKFNRNKKLARYMIEYMFWMYSRFINGNEPTIENIIDFVNKSFLIIPNFTYKNIPKQFSVDSGLMKNGKIVLESDEMLKRLVYVLRLAIIRQKNSIIKYKDRINIINFYSDITDFIPVSTQVILQGKDSINKWIREQKFNSNITNQINVGRVLPYFFKNKYVDDNIYIAQNTDTLEKAIGISQTWRSLGYNPGVNPPDGIEEEYTLYSYRNENDVIKYGHDSENKIIGYKIDNTNMFTVLLN
jgi:hypothetical protein